MLYLGPDNQVRDPDELYHYGVLGMKWGVRRNPSRAYERASKKLKRLDKKVDKLEAKAVKKSRKADDKMASRLSRTKSKVKAQAKAERASAKLAKRARKADKWIKAMEKNFDQTTVSLSKEQVEMGKRYTDLIRARAVGHY